jgi:hypothetical protein
MTLSDDDRMTEMINGYWITRLSMQRRPIRWPIISPKGPIRADAQCRLTTA